MKAFGRFLGVLGSAWLLLPLAGCQTVAPNVVSQTTRFGEADAAGLIVLYRRWDNLQILRPDSRQGGYLPLLKRDDLEARLLATRLASDLAVVVVGEACWNVQKETLASEWQQLLAQHGFRRFVILRTTGANNEVDGLPVMYDSRDLAVGMQPTVAASVTW